MPRAIETASIIGEHTGLRFKAQDLFREGRLPGTPEFNLLMTKGQSAKAKAARKNADLAFKTLFKPPKRGQNTEVVVAHGNVIRYWVCKALGISEDRWLKMDVSHGSITTIRISKKGNFVLLGFAEKDHLPFKMRTYV